MVFDPITPIPSLPTKPDADADLWNTRYLEIDALFDDLEDATSTTYWNGESFETPAGTSDGHVIKEEGTPLTQRVNLDFIGASVTAADGGGSTTNVTVNGAVLEMNIEALAGDHTLTDASEPIQALTPDAARDVNLPAEAVTNPTFLIANPSGSGFVLTIKDDGGATITTVADGETKLIVPDGVTWYATSDTIQLDELTTTAATDLFEIMDDVGGTPTKKKISVTSLFDDIPVDVTIAKGTPIFTVNATGGTDARFTLEDAGTPKAHFWYDQSEGTLVIENDNSGGAIVFNTNVGGWNFFNDDVSLDQILFGATGSAIFNEQGNDVDFRIEAVGEANAFFLQGSDGKTGFGGTPDSSARITVQQPVVDDTQVNRAIFNQLAVSGAGAITKNQMGMYNQAVNTNTNTLNRLLAALYEVKNNSTGTIEEAVALRLQGLNSNAGGTIEDLRTIEILTPTATGTIDLAHGLYVSNINTATSNFAIRTFAGMIVFNEGGEENTDVRMEGDTLSHMFFTDATPATENIALLAAAAPNWQAMDRGLFIGNMSNAPTGDPTGGGYLFVDAGALKWHGSSGTVTPIAAA
ncbi:hypothetical protein KAR91_49105 [Candidatus Pacearchaeota archaeon]|nr:hypothetical protein [Candidatus Pacearchaeota archaeon]